jgi:RNA polymerase sigma-70 factor (ECF subfamily)
MSNQEDIVIQSLMQRCQEGEQEAFSELFKRFGQLIQNVSFRITRNPELQKDIFQEVVGSVIKNIGSFRGECAFSTWLFTVTSNIALNAIRKEHRETVTASYETVDERGTQEARDQLQNVEHNELMGHVRTALAMLPPDGRRIMALFYFKELSIQEIARTTGKSQGAIKAVLFKARLKIIKHLHKQGLGN